MKEVTCPWEKCKAVIPNAEKGQRYLCGKCGSWVYVDNKGEPHLLNDNPSPAEHLQYEQ